MITIKYADNKKNIEMVERKGIGHPDTLCDAIAEAASRLYAQFCMKKYNRVAHHWFDKVMLIGGESAIKYGSGKLIKPYVLIFAGKCAKSICGESVPLYSIFREAAREVLENSLTGFSVDEHLQILDMTVDHQGAGRANSRYRPDKVSDMAELSIFKNRSNDCNLLASHYPLTELEELVLNTEHYINSKDFKEKFTMTGWDVKIVGYKKNNNMKLIVNVPFLADFVKSREHYDTLVDLVRHDLEIYVAKYSSSVELIINPQDKTGHPYITVFGSAADTGDVGVVGRGNRINGLITPMQAMSIEAPAGKNPIDHTGKIYASLAEKLSKKISEAFDCGAEVFIYTYKEELLIEPTEIHINITRKLDEENEKKIYEIVNDQIGDLDEIVKKYIYEGVVLW